ncbi:hypothetical protein NUSPORA_00343 [Nucleospora cyclopteri]
MQSSHVDLFKNKANETEEHFADDATRVIKSGTNILLEIMKTTLGPKGSMKILQGKENAITNDGAYILNNLLIESPSARILIDSSIAQDFEEGDGTTSIAVLSALILKHSYESKVAPIHIIRGINLATSKIEEILNYKKIPATHREIENLVKTTLNSKVLNSNLQLFTDICINAVNNLDDDCNLNLINIVKIEGDLSESRWIDGIIVKKELKIPDQNLETDFQSESEDTVSKEVKNLSLKNKLNCNILYEMKNPKILVANTSLDYDKIKVFSSQISVTSIRELEEIEGAEKERMMDKISNICEMNFDIFVNRQIIYDYPMQLLLDRNKTVMENSDFENVEKLSKVLEANVLSHFSKDNKENEEIILGKCEKVESIEIKGTKLTRFSGVKKGASTIVLFGSNASLLEEAERSLHDALCVLKRIKKSKFVLLGGGNVESMLSFEMLKYSQEIKTLLSEGPLILSKALMEFVEILCENCGFNAPAFRSAITALYNLRTTYQKNNFTSGLNVKTGEPGCMKSLQVFEGFSMKLRVLKAACETAQAIFKCDGVIQQPPRERQRH